MIAAVRLIYRGLTSSPGKDIQLTDDGGGQAANDPRVLSALRKFDAAKIRVSPDGQRELAGLLYTGEQRNKPAADKSFDGFVSRIIDTAQKESITELDGGTVQHIVAQIDWWPFSGG